MSDTSAEMIGAPGDPGHTSGVKAIRVVQWALILISIGAAAVSVFRYEHFVQKRADAIAAEAQLNMNLAVLQMSVGDLQQSIKDSYTSPSQACQKLAKVRSIIFSGDSKRRENISTALSPDGSDMASLASVLESACVSTDGGPADTLARFMDPYLNGVSARIAGDYPTSFSQYSAALAVTGPIQPDWTMRALEGKAYAELMRGSVQDAINDADRASKIDPPFSFADDTAMKAMCAAHYPAAAIVDRLAATRRALDQAVAKSAAGAPGRCFFLRDVFSLEADKDLFARCQYAGIAPRPLSMNPPAFCVTPTVR